VVYEIVPEEAVMTAFCLICLEVSALPELVQIVFIETAKTPGFGSGKEQGNSFRINMYVRL
jgi:hypothetical protein